MDWILFIRIIIFVTFLLLLAEGIAAIIISRHLYSVYVRKHHELEVELEQVKRRVMVLEGQHT
jgi:ABC-type iron transport system FetAB permease component